MTDTNTGGEGRTQLAAERTRIASDRTLMAWIRTAVSLVGFGFSIPHFFRYLREAESAKVSTPSGPYYFGLMLIGLGVLSLMAGTLEHVRLLRRIAALASRPLRSLASASLGTAVMMLGFGVYAFILVLIRL
jgi:putative membrane protein